VPKLWAGPAYKDGFAILIKYFCKENLATHVNKGGKSNEAVGEAGHNVAYSTGCRQVGNQCKFGTFNRSYMSAVGHPDFNSGCFGIIVVDRSNRVKVKPRQTQVNNAPVAGVRMEGGITAIKLSNS
jgi:hypothetical protein